MSHSNPYRTMMEYLDNLVKSRFIEMFGNDKHPMKRIGDLLIQKTETTYVNNPESEMFVTLSSHGKGAKQRIIKDGKIPVKFTAYRIKAGQFIYSRIDARNGAFAIVPDNLNDAVVSKDFPVFDINQELIVPEYFINAVLQDIFVAQIQKDSFGATNRQRVKEEFFSNYVIPYPPLEEQIAFVTLVRHIEKMKSITQECIDKYDQLVKSRFIEMFGDPYVSPKFESVPFLECMIFNPVKSEIKNMNDSTEVSFVPMEFVGTDGSINTESVKTLGEVRKGYTYFREGDVVFAKITPCFENGKVAIAEGCKNGIGFGTTEFHVVRPIKGISNNIWLKYLLKSDSLRHLASSNMSGTAGQKRVQLPFFEKIKIGLPPIDLQEQFAIFVQQVDKSKFKSEE